MRNMDSKTRFVGEDPVILPRAGRDAEPQHLLLAMLGDYWFQREHPLPSAAMVDLLAKFDVKESTSRQAMRRLAIKGHLQHYRDGRKTGYGFPPRSQHVIETRPRHVVGFGRDGAPWNGKFTVVVFTIPEELRELRRELRTQLLAIGFGNLHDAVWISPRDRQDAANELVDELGITAASVFYGPATGPRDAGTLVAEAFDTVRLREVYDEFIADFEPLLHELRGVTNPLVTRTRIVNRWLTLRTMDPNLPAEVLAADWPRGRAHQIFIALYDRLGQGAAAEFREVVSRHDAELADLTAYFTSDVLQTDVVSWRRVDAS